ncbi:hypothetical protein [Pseudomonas cichorii]|uniref:Uncharacterized protein n=1 Tax=Pseudomonas cichorii TaxID=36746 RepID=A0ABQ1DTD1_PSECI|nr:hypothetical protein [Pseudomonas cichorii]AHF66005.1 hypothetical protein PCH70_08520 [Pseudomonas cichorii JBC1]QVE17970.1 hypothetical protein KGD89_04200 [Pseudomonas cichorii]SDP00746.1 hypothetical protein SAMN05216599_116144 [Pseudomonas cichorii]GFM68682.1 hypothetical protein PSCICJ_48000 [Pseudomonas cichorii]GFM94179.1 hypothetical protein PSCICP_41510 [Pseudomonas cichorii]
MSNAKKARTQNALPALTDAQLNELADKLVDRMADDLAERVFLKMAERQGAAHQQQVAAEQSQAMQAAEFDKSLAQVYARYPFLNDASAEANFEAIRETLDLTKALEDSGISVADAVWQAATKVGPKYETHPVH